MVTSTYNLRKTRKAQLKDAPAEATSSPQKAKPTIAGQPRPGGDGDGDGLSDNASEVRPSIYHDYPRFGGSDIHFVALSRVSYVSG